MIRFENGNASSIVRMCLTKKRRCSRGKFHALTSHRENIYVLLYYIYTYIQHNLSDVTPMETRFVGCKPSSKQVTSANYNRYARCQRRPFYKRISSSWYLRWFFFRTCNNVMTSLFLPTYMPMHICMYLCMCACVHVYMYVYLSIYKCVIFCVSIFICT